MWEHSFSNPLGSHSKRCGYCGKFFLPEKINASTGLCNICAIKMAKKLSNTATNTADIMEDSHSESPLSSVPEESPEEYPEGNPVNEPMPMEVDEQDGSSDAHEEPSGIHKDKPGRENSDNQEECDDSDDIVEHREGMTAQVCGRCWEKRATCTLYSCPTCEDCVATAKAERVSFISPDNHPPSFSTSTSQPHHHNITTTKIAPSRLTENNKKGH